MVGSCNPMTNGADEAGRARATSRITRSQDLSLDDEPVPEVFCSELSKTRFVNSPEMLAVVLVGSTAQRRFVDRVPTRSLVRAGRDGRQRPPVVASSEQLVVNKRLGGKGAGALQIVVAARFSE